MIRGLLLKSLLESWVTTAILAGALMGIEAILAYVLPTFVQQFSPQLLQLEFFRSIIQALLGTDVGDMLSSDALHAIAWAHPVVLTILWAHGIVFFTRLPAGEIDRGTIDVFLGLPVSRWRAYASDLAVFLTSGLVVISLGLLGCFLGGLAVEPEYRPRPQHILLVVVNLFCLYLAVGGLSALVSSLSERRGRAVALVVGMLVASFLLNFLAQLWPPAARLAFLSLMHYHQPLLVLREAGSGTWPLADMTVLTLTAAITWTAGGVCFARRDICTC